MSDRTVSEVVALDQQRLGRSVLRWVVAILAVLVIGGSWSYWHLYDNVRGGYNTTRSELTQIQTLAGQIKKLDNTQFKDHTHALRVENRQLSLENAQLKLLTSVLSPAAVKRSRAETALFLYCIYNRVDHDTERLPLYAECDALAAQIKAAGS